MKLYTITIAEPFVRDEPNPVIAEGLGIVYGPDLPDWQDRYLLLKVLEPFKHNGDLVELLVVCPRHKGTSIKDFDSKMCFVGIARAKPGIRLQDGASFKKDDVENWSIGCIKAC